jgi:hypothetical protein
MGTYTSADDKDCEPLQAADAAIFEVRRALNLSLKYWPGKLRKQYKILAAATMFIITHTKKEQLLHIVATHKPGEPFNLDELMKLKIRENIKIRI